MQVIGRRRDPAALVTLVRRKEDGDFLAPLATREELLALAGLVVGDDGVCAFEDRCRRTVVFLEFHGLCLGPVTLELEDVANVGTAPRVDRLVIITDDHEVSVLGGEQLGDFVLRLVGVLVLVDEDVAKALTVLAADVRMLREQHVYVDEQIVEVHRVGAFEALLIGFEDLCRRLVERVMRTRLVIARADELVFR